MLVDLLGGGRRGGNEGDVMQTVGRGKPVDGGGDIRQQTSVN